MSITTADFIAKADSEYALMMAANSAEPYDHETYERHRRMMEAAIALAVDGEQRSIEALVYHVGNSGETPGWLLNKYGIEYLVENS